MTLELNYDYNMISQDQYLVIGKYDLSTYDGKMKAIAKSVELLDLPTETDKKHLFEAITSEDFIFDTGLYYVDTQAPLYTPENPDDDGFLMKENFQNPDTRVIENFYGIDLFKNATAFTLEELENMPKKFQSYINENFILPEYIARQQYDPNFKEWLDSILEENQPVDLEKEEKTFEQVEPNKVVASIGRARG